MYRGPVFIVQETEDLNEPYIAQIVEGGIEMVQPVNLKSFRKPLPPTTTNDSVPEIQDDPEYFAVLVTPETVAQAQISRSTTITIPLPVLLLGVSSRIPWVMVLKRHSHFDYFRNLTPVHVSISSYFAHDGVTEIRPTPLPSQHNPCLGRMKVSLP